MVRTYWQELATYICGLPVVGSMVVVAVVGSHGAPAAFPVPGTPEAPSGQQVVGSKVAVAVGVLMIVVAVVVVP